MSSQGIHRAIETQAEALGPVLYAGVASAVAAAHVRRRGLEHSKYPHLLPLLVRTELREFLESNPIPLGWDVDGDPRKMGQLLLWAARRFPDALIGQFQATIGDFRYPSRTSCGVR